MPLDTARCDFARKQFQLYYKKDKQADKFLTLSLEDAKTLGDKNREQKVWYDFLRHSYFYTNSGLMKMYVDSIRKTGYETNNFRHYFFGSRFYLEFITSEGNFEFALNKARELEQEAKELNYEEGIFYAMVAQGNVFRFSKNYTKAIEVFNNSLQNKNLRPYDLLSPYTLLTNCYEKTGQYEKALEYHFKLSEIIADLKKQDTLQIQNLKDREWRLEVTYARTYLGLKNTEKALLHLEKAEKTFRPNIFRPFVVSYYQQWAEYYAQKSEWESSIRMIDSAIGYYNDTDKFTHQATLLNKKAHLVLNSGDAKLAASIFKRGVYQTDSLRNVLLGRQEEILNNNRQIQQSLIEKEERAILMRWLILIGIYLALLISGFFTVRLYRIRKKLIRTGKIIQKEKENAFTADKSKEKFLRQVSNEIRIPLTSVVYFSEKLIKENDAESANLSKYKKEIDKNARHLMQIINNVLDLSRLESGKAIFEKGYYSIGDLCKRAAEESQYQYGKKVISDEQTEALSGIEIETDASRFIGLLRNLFCGDNSTRKDCSYRILTDETEEKVILELQLASLSERTESEKLKHEFNRFFIELSKGKYDVITEKDSCKIRMTFDIKKDRSHS